MVGRGIDRGKGNGTVEQELARISTDAGLAWAKLDSLIDGFFRSLPNLVIGLAAFFLVLLIGRIVRGAIRGVARRRGRPDIGQVFGSLAYWAVAILAVLVAMTIIFPSVRPVDLLATLGVGSVAIGFAFKDVLQNLLAGVLILVRQPFRRGDQIVAGAFEGTVEHIQARATLIRTYDGRRVVIPNADIYTRPIVVNTAFDAAAARRRSASATATTSPRRAPSSWKPCARSTESCPRLSPTCWSASWPRRG
jgi:small-conductance mechanosensitive channel